MACTGLQNKRGKKSTDELSEIKALILEYIIVSMLEQLLSPEFLDSFCGGLRN